MKKINLIQVAFLLTSALFTISCKKNSVSDVQCQPSFNKIEKASSGELGIIVLGDQGCGNDNARLVANEMNEYAADTKIDFVLGVGDNIYNSGVSGIDDNKFRTHFENMYNQVNLDIPFHLVLGNHDYEGSTNAQIDYTAVSDRWVMPSSYYTYEKSLPTGEKVTFLAIDTYELLQSEGERQLAWIENILKQSLNSRWRIVHGHHPMYNNGDYENYHDLIAKLALLFKRYNVNLYIAGHEHNIQYLNKVENTNYIITGSGCKIGLSECKSNTIYNANHLGFTGLRLTNEKIVVESVLVHKGVSYAYEIR